MAYTINLTDGTIFATVADGTINTSSSMILVGKNYAGYGEFLDENFIHLLENSSNNTAPAAPLTGQLWWDKVTGVMKVYNGSTFKVVCSATAASSAPTSNVAGDLWFDSINGQLKVYSGTKWVLVGPASSSSQGTSGSVVDTVRDNLNVDHVVIKLYVADTVVGIVSKDPTFTPQTAIAGFATIGPGLQLSSAVSNALFRGTSTNAQTLNGISSTGFLSAISNSTTTGTLGILNDNGLSVGADSEGRILVVGSDVYIRNQQQNGNLYVQVNAGGNTISAISIAGSTGIVTIPTSLVVAGNISGTFTGNVNGNIVAPGSNTQVIFNDNGLAGASAGLTFNKTTGNLAISGNVSATNFVGNGSLLTGINTNNISNGTSNLSVISAGGNIRATIGGVDILSITDDGISNERSNGVGNIGSASSYFNRVFATSTSALYSDVAERFAADEFLAPGTVVELGGEAEITMAREPLSDTVFGVISTLPAYLMNGGAGNDDTHPPVAMTGRVPVRVIGGVRKGDRLVSAGNGLARAASPGEATAFNVIGRALESKESHEEGLVDAIVATK